MTWRTDLPRECVCGHPYGDHAPAAPHACLSFAVPPAGARPGCRCAAFAEQLPLPLQRPIEDIQLPEEARQHGAP